MKKPSHPTMWLFWYLPEFPLLRRSHCQRWSEEWEQLVCCALDKKRARAQSFRFPWSVLQRIHGVKVYVAHPVWILQCGGCILEEGNQTTHCVSTSPQQLSFFVRGLNHHRDIKLEERVDLGKCTKPQWQRIGYRLLFHRRSLNASLGTRFLEGCDLFRFRVRTRRKGGQCWTLQQLGIRLRALKGSLYDIPSPQILGWGSPHPHSADGVL